VVQLYSVLIGNGIGWLTVNGVQLRVWSLVMELIG
jgi:hypothetical protein